MSLSRTSGPGSLLAKHIRTHCAGAGHRQLQKLGGGTVSKILATHPVKPHKIQYYLERRDPEYTTAPRYHSGIMARSRMRTNSWSGRLENQRGVRQRAH